MGCLPMSPSQALGWGVLGTPPQRALRSRGKDQAVSLVGLEAVSTEILPFSARYLPKLTDVLQNHSTLGSLPSFSSVYSPSRKQVGRPGVGWGDGGAGAGGTAVLAPRAGWRLAAPH